MIGSFIAGLWAGYALAIPVGALAVLLVTLTARTSFRIGASGALGAATADSLYAIAALLGGAVLAHAIQPVQAPLRWLAAAILIAMAAHIAVTAVRGPRSQRRPVRKRAGALDRPGGAFVGFLGLTLLSPWAIVYFAALIMGGHIGADAGVGVQAAFVGAVFIASVSWQLVLATGGAVLGRALTSPTGRMATALLSSLVIGALAVNLLIR